MMFHIVPMTARHIDQVESIERQCFSDPWSRRLLEEQLRQEGAVSLAAVTADGHVLGYISAQTVLDEGYINNVAVRPENRRRGIATQLLEELRRRGEEMDLAFLTLEVRASNLAAQALYAKEGYWEVGCRRNYYEHPREDAILMTLELKDESENLDAGGAG